MLELSNYLRVGNSKENMPDPDDIHPLLRRMEQRGDIQALRGVRQIYTVTVPYAGATAVTEDEVLLEINPYATLSHLSALVFHGLTDQLPQELTASLPKQARAILIPLDTDPTDWEGIAIAPGATPTQLLGWPVRWVRLDGRLFFGYQEYRPQKYAVRVTTPERTLIDVLQRPELGGGIDSVLQAWARGLDTLNLEILVELVELYDVGVLRQRVGFLLETLGVSHPLLDTWQRSASRGGSSKLVAGQEYSPVHSERWSLSINTPIAVLESAAR